MSDSLPSTSRVVYLVAPERLELREVELPRPRPGELLLEIEAATTCGTDLKVWKRGGHPRMLVVPGPFGHEMTGRVAAVGDGVASFAVGDALVVANSASCGDCSSCRSGRENLCERLLYLNGAFADYLLVPAPFVTGSCHRRPPALPARLASIAEPLACVEHGLERLALSPPAMPRDVLVLGAGSLGLLFVAALASDGHRVVASDPHAERLELARALGAVEVLAAPLVHDGADANRPAPLARAFDVAIDATGNLDGWSRAVAAARPGGTALFFGGCAPGSVLPLPTGPVHYDELALLGCYHHTPRAFARAVARLAADPQRYARLLSSESSLEGVENALREMQARRVIKVLIRP